MLIDIDLKNCLLVSFPFFIFLSKEEDLFEASRIIMGDESVPLGASMWKLASISFGGSYIENQTREEQ
jgi:hypothetical protein